MSDTPIPLNTQTTTQSGPLPVNITLQAPPIQNMQTSAQSAAAPVLLVPQWGQIGGDIQFQIDLQQEFALQAGIAQANLTAHTTRHDNPHGVTQTQVGLPNVANLAPADYPVSTAQAAAITAAVTGAVPTLTITAAQISDSNASGRTILTGANASGASIATGATAAGVAVTNAATAAAQRGVLIAAQSGANSDILSLSGLTTPLSVLQGGLGGPNPQGGIYISPSRRNLLDNAAMNVAQRYGQAAQTTNGIWILDRWQALNQLTSRVQFAQVTTNTVQGFANRLRMSNVAPGAPATTDIHGLNQSLENLTIAPLNFGTVNAVPLVLSFWVVSSVIGTYSVSLRNFAGTRSFVSTFTIATINVPQKVVIQISGDTAGSWAGWGASVGGAALNITLGGGATYQTSTLNAWQAGNFLCSAAQTQFGNQASAILDITGVQLEVGNTPTPFEQLAYDDDLRRCQRFLPGWSPMSSMEDCGYAVFQTSSQGVGSHPFQVATRIPVSGIATSPATNFNATTTGATAILNGIAFTSGGYRSARTQFTQAGATWGTTIGGYMYSNTAGSFMLFTGAEI